MLAFLSRVLHAATASLSPFQLRTSCLHILHTVLKTRTTITTIKHAGITPPADGVVLGQLLTAQLIQTPAPVCVCLSVCVAVCVMCFMYALLGTYSWLYRNLFTYVHSPSLCMFRAYLAASPVMCGCQCLCAEQCGWW